MITQMLRERVLDFMKCNPGVWHTKALAKRFGVGMKRLDHALSQLNSEGKLVSCTVKTRGRRSQLAYRVAAILTGISSVQGCDADHARQRCWAGSAE